MKCIVFLLAAAVFASCHNSRDPEHYFTGRPSPYAMTFNRTLDGTDASLVNFLRIPAGVSLAGWYADTYQVDLGNILKRTEPAQFARAYAALAPEDLNALRPYLMKLGPEVRENIRRYSKVLSTSNTGAVVAMGYPQGSARKWKRREVSDSVFYKS